MMTSKEAQLPDRIAEMFQGSTVLITGGSGFLGKLLIEKLLRDCSGIKRIYLLMRHKKGRTPQERLHDVFDNVVFCVLKEQQPQAINKCKIIAGDITEVDLGISPEDRKILQEEVEFIYHSAASTRFDDTVRVAVRMNTRGTKYMLDLAQECKKLKLFMHVSTAYAYPKEKVLYEKAYKPPADPHEILKAINFDKEDKTGETEKLLGDCPNTYTFSKALAEGLVVEQLNKLPAVIVRPSVVCPTWIQPIPGWCNNLQGPMGLFVGAGKGIIRTMYVNSETYADFIPADIVINAMLVASWGYVCSKREEDNIINLISSSEVLLNWEELINMGKEIIYNEVPFNGCVWYPGGSLKNNKFTHNVCFFLFQLIPAIFIDALLIVLGYKPVLYQIQRRIQKGGEVFEFYTTKAWNFATVKAENALKKLNAREKKIYKIDAEGLDIRKYLIQCIYAVRRNNLKEPDDTIPAAKRHMQIMYVVDLITKALLVMVAIYYIYKWFLLQFFHI